MTSLEQAAVPTFAGHQTFHPRFGWLKKGFDKAVLDPRVFLAEDATVRLGVGKNMVEAIRFWCHATRVLARVPDPERPRTSMSVPTHLGQALLAEEGFDPYFEDTTTLWILHWQVCSPPDSLPIWWLAFSGMTALEFDESELLSFCVDEVGATTWSAPNASSIRKDVDCLLRMYTTRATRGRQTLDELLDSPFRELGIIKRDPVALDRYRYVRGSKPGLTDTAVAYACLDYLDVNEPGARTASISRLTSDPGSPGQIFKLTEHDVAEALASASRHVSGLRLAAPGGAPQLLLDDNPQSVAVSLLAYRLISRGRDPEPILQAHLVGPGARAPLNDYRLELPA